MEAKDSGFQALKMKALLPWALTRLSPALGSSAKPIRVKTFQAGARLLEASELLGSPLTCFSVSRRSGLASRWPQ